MTVRLPGPIVTRTGARMARRRDAVARTTAPIVPRSAGLPRDDGSASSPAGGRMGVIMAARNKGAVSKKQSRRHPPAEARRAALAAGPHGRAEQVARGLEARSLTPLASHAEFEPTRSRDPIGLLLGQAGS